MRKVKKPAKELIITGKKGSLFASSPIFKRFKNQEKLVESKTRKLIMENFKRLEKGKEISDKKGKIKIKKAFTGTFGGKHKFLTLRVSASGKEFFVKISSPRKIKENVNALELADRHLSKKGYRVDGFKVKVILPYKAVAYKKIGYLVTDFFKQGEVQQISEMRDAEKIIKCMGKVATELNKFDVFDVLTVNSFYNSKTNTILLFDLIKK